MRRYSSAPLRTLIERHPRQESPTFLRTVLGLRRLSVVLSNAPRSAWTRSARYRSAPATFAFDSEQEWFAG